MIDLRRIQDSIQNPPPGAFRQRVGAFAVTIHPENPLPWFNDAVPEAEPTDADIAEMIAMFRKYNRRPRLEFLRELWPNVPAQLESHGFRLKDTQPALVRNTGIMPIPQTNATLRLAKPEDAKVIDEIGDIAFAGDGPDPLREAAIRDSIAAGRSKAAIAFLDDVAVGSGRIVGAPDVREIVSVGTLPQFRRQGIASATTAFLTNDFFADGGEIAWLTATDEAESVYRKLGFEQVAKQVCYLLD